MEILSYIKNEVNALSVKRIQARNKTTWYYEEILGNLSSSYEVILKDNAFVIDIEQDGEFLILSKLFIKEKGKGLGTLLMDILKDYTYREDLMFMIIQVINPEFFRKFDWLTFDQMNCFEFDQRNSSPLIKGAKEK